MIKLIRKFFLFLLLEMTQRIKRATGSRDLDHQEYGKNQQKIIAKKL